MTQEASLYQFFSAFDLPAFPNIAVPDDQPYPYITYPIASGTWDDDAFLTVYIYTKGESVAELTARVRTITDTLKDGGQRLECDGGFLWLTLGNPIVNYMSDQHDKSVKYAILNINCDFITV